MAKRNGAARLASSSRTNTINTKWLQNAVKSIGASAKNVLKNDFAPNLYSAVSSGAETAKSVVSALRTNTAGTGNVQRQISNNKYVKAANNAYKNALADLKAGNFNNDDRLTDALFGDMGFDDIDSFFDDGGFTFDDDGAESNVNVNVIGANSGNNDAMFAMSTQLQKNAEATLKTSQANMNAMIAMNSASMVQIQQFGSNIVSGLDAINSNLTQLIEFNNSNQTKFIESSLAFFERMGAKFDSETNTGGGNEKITADNLFGSGGGINMSQYKEYVKQQFKQTFQGSMVGMAASMIDDNMLDMLASNPLGFATEGLIKFMVPKIVTNAIVGAEEAFNAFMPSLLHKLADWGDSTATGLLGSAKRYIGKIFGVRAERIEGIDKGASIETGPVPFDGYTKMAITEIITKELREQTSYLKSIAENMGVDTKTARENSEVFDWKTGKYIKEKDVTTSIVDEVRSSVLDSMNQGRFGKELRRAGAGLKNEDDQKALQSMIDELMLRLEKNGKFMKFDRESLSDPTSDYRKILSDLSGNYSLKVYLDKYIQDMAEANPYAMMDMSRAIFNASSRRNATIKEIQSNPQKYNLYAARGLDEKALDDLVMDRHKETKVNYEEYEKDETGKFKLNSLGKKIRRGPLETAEITDENGNVVTGYNGNIYETIKNGNIALKTGAESNAKGEINERDKNGGYLAQLSSTTGKGLQNTLAAILNGDSNGALNAIGETFLKQVETIYTGFRENFLDPLKTTLFGKKDEDGFSRDGIFSGIQNSFKDAAGMIQWHITGKSFKDSKGEMHENKEDGDSVIGNLKSMATNIKQGVMEKLFGKTVTDENGNEVKTKGIMAKFQDVVNEGLVGWQEAIFGKELDEEERANLKESMIKNLNERLPASMTGAAVGTGVGLMAGGSLLGTLIGGPVGGAAFGAAIGFASKSEKFQEYLFGKKDENGDRTGGLISKGVQDFFKKNKGFIIGGTALGAAKGALTGGGLLGTLVGGPIGGALLGMASSLVVKSHMFEEFLHGDPKTGQKGIIDSFKSVFKRNKSDEQTAKGLGKALGMGLLGAAGGALTASVVGKMGILGAALTPFGPVGGALVGLGLSIRAQKDNFHTWLFGEKDEEGNKKSEGVLGQFKNMLVANVFHPLKNMAADIFEDAKLTIKYSILDPIRFAIEPIGNALMDIGGKIKDKVMGIFDAGADMLKTNIINPLRDFLFAPITKAITGITKVVYGVTKRVVTFPFRLLDSAVKFSQSLIVDAFKALKKVTIDPIMMLFKNTIIKPTKALFKGLFKAVGFAANILIKKPLDVVGGVTNYVGDKLNRVGKDDRQIRDNGGIEDDCKENFAGSRRR